MSRKNLCLTRLPPALVHKGNFPYEYSSQEQLAWWAGGTMGPVVGRATR
jgi:hypothetical protein